MPAGRLGLGYGVNGVHRFVTVLGLQNTLDVFFSARIFDAADALRMGFVTRVEPRDAFDAAVDGWCEAVAQNAPLTLRALKLTTNALTGSPGTDAQAAGAAAQAAIAACFASDDYREGALAFMQKRAPRFVGA
jgi:enoyl-CoA hydratase